jgi:hypothetical protein
LSFIFDYMKTPDANNVLVDGYVRLLENLSAENKRDLIAKLNDSFLAKRDRQYQDFYNTFGAWDSKESAEEITANIRNARSFNRKTEEW